MGRLLEQVAVVERAAEIARRIKDPAALRAAVEAFSSIGASRQALALATTIGAFHDRAVALSEIAAGLARSGDAIGARATTEKAVGLARMIPDDWERASALG